MKRLAIGSLSSFLFAAAATACSSSENPVVCAQGTSCDSSATTPQPTPGSPPGSASSPARPVSDASAGPDASGRSDASDGSPSAGAKKWHPGYYLSTDRNNTAMQDQSVRFQQYDGSDVADNPHLAGMFNIFRWNQLEGAHGDYSSGIALLNAEIAHLKALAQPKRLIAMIMDEPNYSLCGGAECQTAFFPAYLNDAGCVEFESGTPGTGEKGITHFKIWVPACRQYFIDLLNGLGAALDTEPYLEAVGLNYETSAQDAFQTNGGANEADYDAALAAVSTAAFAAFPHTNLFWSPNYDLNGSFDAIAGWMTDWESKGIGWGDGDSCPRADWGDTPFYNAGEMPVAIWADNITAGYGAKTGVWQPGQYTDHRDSAFLIWKVESSELGYNSVCGGPGLTGMPLSPNPDGYGSVFAFWDTAMHASHGIVEHNTFVGIDEQRWSVGTTNSLWDMVQNHPLTHTACPTSYDKLFGSGSAGSGCDTR